MFVGLFIFVFEEDGEDLETEVDEVGFAVNGDFEVLEYLVLEHLFRSALVFSDPEGDGADGLKEEEDALEVVGLCFGEHLFKKGVEILVEFKTGLSEHFGKGIQHSC